MNIYSYTFFHKLLIALAFCYPRWEFIKENKKVSKQENTLSIKKKRKQEKNMFWTKKAIKKKEKIITVKKKERKLALGQEKRKEKSFFLTFLFSFTNIHLCTSLLLAKKYLRTVDVNCVDLLRCANKECEYSYQNAKTGNLKFIHQN